MLAAIANRLNTFLLVILLLMAGTIIAILATRAAGGPLDPPGPIGSTMRTLSDLVPVWNRTLDSTGGCSSARFSCVMSNAAVLDNETGLVWEKTPTNGSPATWDLAATLCTSLQTGGRFGWRLPTANELLSLKDPANLTDTLPSGHPFSGVSNNPFWTSTTDPLDNSKARWIAFNPIASNEQTTSKMTYTFAGAWCVRGGIGFDTPPASDPVSWSRALPANDGFDSCSSSRFTCVMGGDAVLDHETSLVWQRDPTPNIPAFQADGFATCVQYNGGGRRGWRLPTVAELSTLLDQSNVAPALSLPTGHPFLNLNLITPLFWTATGLVSSPGSVYVISFQGLANGLPGTITPLFATGSQLPPWCVRGPDTQ